MTACSPTLFGRLDRPASVVLFAGLGGSCLGISRATGASPVAAVNHWDFALGLHSLNHPGTRHFREDVWDVSPQETTRGRSLDLMWLSPDCTHHSRARGGKPRETGRRALADSVWRWVGAGIRPRIVMLENVREFVDWGPLDADGKPIPSRKGEHFRAWVTRLRGEGYAVEWRVLSACDYGAPTTRERLYLIGRRDGQPIVWPEPTHGPGRPLPWRTAAECIDWDVPALSIFASREEARTWARATGQGTPQRPLAEATERRIAAGLRRYVLEAKKPGPYLVQVSYGERRGQAPRVLDISRPLGTVVAGGVKHGLCVAWLAKHYGGVVGHGMRRPLGTVTTVDHHSLCLAAVEREDVGDRGRAVAAFLVKYYGTGEGATVAAPLGTVTTLDRFGLVTVDLEGEPWTVVDIAMRMLTPRELARAQGFPDSYILEGSRRDQIGAIGNSVCPPVAEALVRANKGAS